MRSEAYQLLAAREDYYWWHRARRSMITALLRRRGLVQHCRWLDLGCGPGGNLKLLDEFVPDLVVGLDLSPIAIAMAQAKAPCAKIVSASLNDNLAFADGSVDVVTIFNVLYHAWVKSEADVLAEVKRVLRPGGLAVITEPAFPMLVRAMDQAVMTRRRYRRREFAAMCRHAGLEVSFTSYFTSFGFLLVSAMKMLGAVGRLWGRAAPAIAGDLKPLSPFVNNTLYTAARLEAHVVSAGIAMPFGTTLVCVARKSEP
jgi:SAM-dependent methyltransferase